MIADLSANLFTLLHLHFVWAVLFIFLRQDESLDSPHLASIGESRRDNALNPIMGQAILPVFYLN
ncbi:MAG: hypothetical protein WAO02_05035 [Verrucomicrobiia bacterium]